MKIVIKQDVYIIVHSPNKLAMYHNGDVMQLRMFLIQPTDITYVDTFEGEGCFVFDLIKGKLVGNTHKYPARAIV